MSGNVPYCTQPEHSCQIATGVNDSKTRRSKSGLVVKFLPFDMHSPLQYDADQALLTIARQHKSLSPSFSAMKLLREVRNQAL